MKATYLIHILAGGLGLGAGYIAMWSAKGAALHRRSGMVFVYTMLVMCIAGLLMTVVRGIAVSINAPAAMITSYLIITSLLTVKPFAGGGRWLDPLLMAIALAVGLTCLGFGAE